MAQKINIQAFDPKAVCKVEEFSDNIAGSIFRYTPVTLDGVIDPTRPVYYIGQTYLAGQQLRFTMPVESLEAAIEDFAKGVILVLQQMQDNALRSRLLGQDGMPQSTGKPS